MTTVTVEALYDLDLKIGTEETPSDEDFKIILSGASGESDRKIVASQLIARHIEKFPNLKDEAISVMVQLASSDDLMVKKNTINGLSKLFSVAKKPVANCLFAFLGDKEESIISLVTPMISRFLAQDSEFRDILFECIGDHQPEAQVKLFDLVKDHVKFDEQSVPQLISLLEVAFKSCVVEGLRLYGRNKRILSEEQSATLIDGLLTRLSVSLDTNFKDVATLMLPQLFQFTKTIGDAGAGKIMQIVSGKVMPKFATLSTGAQMRILQKIYDLTPCITGDTLLTQVYDIFLTFPKELIPGTHVNISVFESALWALLRLSTANPRTMSKLMGKVLVYTGQPGETDDLSDDSARYLEFTTRMEAIKEASHDFFEESELALKSLLVQEVRTEAAKQEKNNRVKEMQLKRRTGKNCNALATLWLTNKPLTGKQPSTPSWHNKQPKNMKKRN